MAINNSKSPKNQEKHQTIYRVERRPREFTVMSTHHLTDPRISLKLKGLLSFLFSHTDNWQLIRKNIRNHSKDGRDSIDTAIREAIRTGYCQYIEYRQHGKVDGTEYRFYELARPGQPGKLIIDAPAPWRRTKTPQTRAKSTDNGLSVNGKTVTDKTDNGKTAPTNTYSTNTESTNTEESKSSCPSSGEPDAESIDPAPASKSKSGKTFYPDSMEIKLSQRLLDNITRRDSKFKKPNIQVWAKHMDAILRLDGREVAEVEQIIDWCQRDAFWQANILCTEKLRSKFDQLRQRMNSNPNTEGEKNGTNKRHDHRSPLFGVRSDDEPWPEPRVYN